MFKQIAHVSLAYQQRLRADYGTQLATIVTNSWKQAALLQQPGLTISYVRLRNERLHTRRRPVLFVYGFTGGIVANAPFGAALAQRGFDVIMPDQQRAGIARKHFGLGDVTYTQAQNLAAIIIAEGLQWTPLDVVSHSYGSLIFEELLRFASSQNWTCFEAASMVMLAPAGLKRPEWYVGFLLRYRQLLKAGKQVGAPKGGYQAFAAEMFAAGDAFFNANRLRALREGLAIMRRNVHLPYLLQTGVSRIGILLFPGDKLFGPEALNDSVRAIKQERVTVLKPGSLSAIPSSGHSDQQFLPEEVAAIVICYLRE